MGANIAKSLGLPEPILAIIRRHVGGGITAKEAKRLGWPRDTYVPQTLEEKIVSYADKLVDWRSRRVPIEKTIESLSQELPPSSVERVRRLHEEMLALIGDCECLPPRYS
jgi:HD superfamily phosphodiesterase